MLDIIFREYDIRGKVGTELLIDEAYNLTRAIAYYFVQQNPEVKKVAVGMDARTHSPLIQKEVIRGLCESGLDVVIIGVCPTPVLYFALYNLPVDAGIMITASHNPPEYNGIKICLGKSSVWGLQVKEIRNLYRAGAALQPVHRGQISQIPLVDSYITWLVDHFAHLKGAPISAVIDCANGAAGIVMPTLVQRMGWQHVQLLYPEVDGTCPNHEADPVKEKNMAEVKRALATTDAQVGIGLDGDADRMAPMTKSGYLVPGDQLLAILSKQLLAEHPGAGVVMDVKSSSSLLDLVAAWGGTAHLSPSGHAIIKTQMRQHNALLGGELSCHFFFADRYFGYDDGIYAALRLFELMLTAGASLDELLAVVPKKWSSPEVRIACAEDEKQTIINAVRGVFAARADVTMITIDGVRAHMPYGWGIVRASNTQSELCLRFEADSHEGLAHVRRDFIAALQPFFYASILEKCLLESDR